MSTGTIEKSLISGVQPAIVMSPLGGTPFVPAPRMRRDGAAPLIGSSAVMRTVRDRIERVAATDFITLIDGESGTGKELVARQIHDISARRRGPFVPVNCAALVETLLEAELFGIEDRTATGVRGRRGKFECADAGTLFLDEVADLSLSAQAKLLRALQDLAVERVGGHGLHHINTRVVAATNKKLAGLVDARLFRADLYYRLAGIEIHVPPLRERREDILELASYFLERHAQARRLTLSPAAADALLTYNWPGNVRELERMMERSIALARHATIEVEDLPIRICDGFGDILLPSMMRNDTLRAWGSRYVRLVLERSGRNKRKACRALGISYHTLQAYLRYAHRLQLSAAHETPPAFGAVQGPPHFGAAQDAPPFDVVQGAASARRGASASRVASGSRAPEYSVKS